jgi:hypothetical protein
MDESQPLWMNWLRVLHRWGISESVASVLENAGPFSFLAAQVVYISQPILSGIVSGRSLLAFAHMLENPDEKQAFVSFLREAPLRGTGA